MNKPMVYIVGAGPGDKSLLTLKAKKIIERADVILVDRLVNKEILKFAREDVVIEYVGKDNIDGGKTQSSINEKLLDLSKKYRSIVRLKGGDPFLFGRGGEEAEVLKENNIDFEIVPGITSALSVPLYAGIPVTHRDYSSEVHIFTGHTKDEINEIDFKKISILNGTIIFLMGVGNIERIVNNLIDNGKDQNTPIAIIENGTLPDQRVTRSNLNDILNKLKENPVSPPAVIIIGDVVRLNEKLDWTNRRPLTGKKILVTRAVEQIDSITDKLEELGAIVIKMPCIDIIDKSEKIIDNDFIAGLKKYSTILFNSVNGVKLFFNRIKKLNFDSRILGGIKIGAVGEATKKEIEKYNVVPDIMPESYTVNDMLDESIGSIGENRNILIITSDASPVDIDELKSKYNINANKIELYETKIIDIDIELLKSILSQKIDIITFMSSFTVRSFFENISKIKNNINLENSIFASIGPVTTKTIHECGYKAAIEAKRFCVEGLIESIIDYCGGKACFKDTVD